MFIDAIKSVHLVGFNLLMIVSCYYVLLGRQVGYLQIVFSDAKTNALTSRV